MTERHDPAEQLRSLSWAGPLTPDEAMALCRHAREMPGLASSTRDGGFHITARYEDVTRVLDDPSTFSSEPSVFRPIADQPPFPCLETDPPHHQAWRDLFREVVHPTTMRALVPVVRADVDACIDDFVGRGSADLVADLAHHIPSQAICHAVGIDDPVTAREVTEATMAGLLAGGSDPDSFPKHVAAFGELALPLIEERRRSPREDFLTRLANAEFEGRPLSHPEMVGCLFGLFGAGHHSTASAMASFFCNVLSRPAVKAQLLDDPGLIPRAAEESLRLSPPFFGFYRRATTDTTVAGTAIAAGDTVLANWVSANRDPAQFEDPDEFRMDRVRNKHVAFGYGIHLCAGAPLARLELRLAMEQVLARIPDVHLTGPFPVRYFGGAGATYLDAVHVAFTPRAVTAGG